MYKIGKDISYNEEKSIEYDDNPSVFVKRVLEDGVITNQYYLIKKYGYIHLDGIILSVSKFHKGVSIVKMTRGSYLIDSNGSPITKDMYFDIEGPIGDNYIATIIDGKKKALLSSNGILLTMAFDDIVVLPNGNFKVISQGFNGVINSEGRFLFPLTIGDIPEKFLKDEANKTTLVQKGNTIYGIYDDIRIVLGKNMKLVSRIPDTDFIIVYDSSSKNGYRIVNRMGHFTHSFNDIRVEDDYIIFNNSRKIPINEFVFRYNLIIDGSHGRDIVSFDTSTDLDGCYSGLCPIIEQYDSDCELIRNKVFSEYRKFTDKELELLRKLDIEVLERIKKYIEDFKTRRKIK